MDIETMETLRAVTEYLRASELTSYEESDRDPAHIFADVLKLEAYLDGDDNAQA